jgi:hypothetical protein
MSTTTEMNAYETEVREILGKLQQSERDVIADWLNHQHRLETDQWKGFSNCSVLVSWLLQRGFAISSQNLSTALGNCQTNGKRRIYWKELPKERSEFVAGRRNHSVGETDNQKASVNEREYINGRRNHAAVKPITDQEVMPTPPVDAWKQITESYLKQWRTHGQRATLQAEYDRGIATGKSWREIGAALSRIVKSWQQGR